MIKRDELISYIALVLGKEFLQKAAKIDDAANGVQILGSPDVSKVAVGVTLNEAFLEKAVEWGAQFAIFHHGLDLRTIKSRLPLYLQKRLQLIFQYNLTIAGFHYALDAHPEIGNNALIIKKLGASLDQSLFEEWGYTATFNQNQSIASLQKQCEDLFNHQVLAFLSGPDEVKTIGVVSGAGKPNQSDIEEMKEKGVELYISGETSEASPSKMSEESIHYFVCGHYATEVFGIQALGEKIKDHFGDRLEVKFIDIPNQV